MAKLLTLLFIFLLTLGSAAGYIFLTEQINAGNQKIEKTFHFLLSGKL